MRFFFGILLALALAIPCVAGTILDPNQTQLVGYYPLDVKAENIKGGSVVFMFDAGYDSAGTKLLWSIGNWSSVSFVGMNNKPLQGKTACTISVYMIQPTDAQIAYSGPVFSFYNNSLTNSLLGFRFSDGAGTLMQFHANCVCVFDAGVSSYNYPCPLGWRGLLTGTYSIATRERCFYVNGVLVRSEINTFDVLDIIRQEGFFSTSDQYDMYGRPFRGSIDEATLWDIAMTYQQVRMLYANKTISTVLDNINQADSINQGER